MVLGETDEGVFTDLLLDKVELVARTTRRRRHLLNQSRWRSSCIEDYFRLDLFGFPTSSRRHLGFLIGHQQLVERLLVGVASFQMLDDPLGTYG